MAVSGRLLSFWRACARTKTGNSTRRRDLADARAYTIFGTLNVTIFDLLPTAVFLLAPHVTCYVTGPSAILSVVIGALAAILSGFSFLDLRCRVWKSTTSTHDAIYRTGSEISSFAVAWSSVAQSVALTSALVRGCSQSLNYLMGQRLTVLSLSLFGWVPAPQTYVVDVLGFMVCMVVWALVALRLALRPPRMVLFGLSVTVFVVLGIVVGAAATALQVQNWVGVEKFFPAGYEGVMSGASIFYLSFTVFEDLSRSVEYSSPKSYKLHLRSSLLAVGILGLILAGSSSVMSLMASGSNLTTEQPFSEVFEVAGVHAWAKYLICVATMVFLIPGIFTRFTRSVETLEDLARDGLIARVLVSSDDTQERSVVLCMVVGCLCALGCAALSVVTLCQLAAMGVLVEHLIVVVTVLTIRFQAADAGKDTVGGAKKLAGNVRSGDGVVSSVDKSSRQLPSYRCLKENERRTEDVGEDVKRREDMGEVEAEAKEAMEKESGYRGLREDVKRREDMGKREDEEKKAEENDYSYRGLPEKDEKRREDGEDDYEEAKENDSSHRWLREKHSEEDDNDGADTDGASSGITNIHQPPNSVQASLDSETPVGATEKSSGAPGDNRGSNESVPSLARSAGTRDENSPTQSKQFPSKTETTNSFDESANETDIDAIVEEYLSSKQLRQTNQKPVSPSKHPPSTVATYRMARLSILLYVTSCIVLTAILTHAQSHIRAGHPVWIVALVLSTVVLLVGLVWLRCQPEGTAENGEEESRLQVRNLSLIYVAAILVNCSLVVTQQEVTSAVFGGWSALGLGIYVIHGVRRDRQDSPPEGHLPDEQTSLLKASSSVYREDKLRDRKSFIFGDDLFNGSSSLP